MHMTPTPATDSADSDTIPVAILTAVSRAIASWTTEVYPGETARVEAARRDTAARRPHTWHATARISNGVRLHFTLVVHGDGTAWVTRHARLPSGDMLANADAQSSAHASHDPDDDLGWETSTAWTGAS